MLDPEDFLRGNGVSVERSCKEEGEAVNCRLHLFGGARMAPGAINSPMFLGTPCGSVKARKPPG